MPFTITGIIGAEKVYASKTSELNNKVVMLSVLGNNDFELFINPRDIYLTSASKFYILEDVFIDEMPLYRWLSFYQDLFPELAKQFSKNFKGYYPAYVGKFTIIVDIDHMLSDTDTDMSNLGHGSFDSVSIGEESDVNSENSYNSDMSPPLLHRYNTRDYDPREFFSSASLDDDEPDDKQTSKSKGWFNNCTIC